jgi:FkbH-like protein
MPSTSTSIAVALRENRNVLAVALAASLAEWDKYSGELTDQTKHNEFAQRETVAFVDYLFSYFSKGDTTYRDLYLGEKLKQCFDQRDSFDEALARRRQITTLDMQIFAEVVGRKLDDAASKALADELRSIRDLLAEPGEKTCRVLLLGDCLFIDLLGFLAVPLIKAGIRLAPTFVTSKLIGQQHRELRQLGNQEFDLVFYSPFTYSFHIEFSQFQSLKALDRHTKDAIDSAKADVKSTLQLLKDIFSCPIFVHNTANLRRHDGSWQEQTKTVLTRPIRTLARRAINNWLPAYLDGLNSTLHRLFLLDEVALLRGNSERALSKYFYSGGLQHPARFSKVLAPVYEDIIIAQTMLTKKKVVICDLDNTVWRGVIGEGAVAHFHDRQTTLRTLRKKGLLLAICSKNDPKNVHWRNGTLSEEDFVCQQVNWDSKSTNIRRIAKTLNLKAKDFIFIDDRPDERALVKGAIPDITVLDAESESTWSQLSVLASILDGSGGDRTLAYRQREERERFLKENTDTSDTEALANDRKALEKLNLQLTIRLAARDELKRVFELINRTNQFNMCGTRTSLQEVTRWNESDRHSILVAEASDKFGGMGVISIAVYEETNRGIEIIAFVLSCRVFGYGIESALLSYIKQRRPSAIIYGHFKKTPYNEPCHRTYPDNGFSWENSEWVLSERTIDPKFEWLTILTSDRPIETAGG